MRKDRQRRGVVLVLVAAIIIMISLVGLSFVVTMSTENKLVHLRGEELQRSQVVASGGELLGVFAEQPRAVQLAAGGLWDNPALFRGLLVRDEPDEQQRGRVSIVAPRIENDEIVGLRCGAEDESARLNLATLLLWDQQFPGAGADALMSLPGMTQATAAAILDWIDADSVARPGGAESDYYADSYLPYAPRNGVPATLEELLLVRGVTRSLLLGSDTNANFQLEPQETGGRGGGGGAELAWASLLTVASAERNVDEQGRPRVDLNDADLQRLYRSLSAAVNERLAQYVVLYRQFGPYAGPMPTGQSSPAASTTSGSDNAAAAPALKLTWRDDQQPAARAAGAGPPASASDSASEGSAAGSVALTMPARAEGKYRLISPLDLVGSVVRVPSPGRTPPQYIPSPLAAERTALGDLLPAVLDRTTVVSSPVIRGRINVNLAPRCVLRAIPGIDAALAEEIVARRRPIADDSVYRQPTWLLSEGLVDLERMKALLPYLTCGGDVWRAQIVGGFESGGPLGRAEVVVDATVTPPRQVYWRDLRLAGPGFPREVVGAAANSPAPP